MGFRMDFRWLVESRPKLSRWARVVAGLALAILGTPRSARADDVVYLRQPVFQIPIQVASTRVSDITELQLYVSTDRGQTWRMVRTARPSQQAFTFRAQADGEYWFTLAYVDRDGKVEPEDIRAEPAGLKVILDTHAPEVELAPLARTGNQFGASWVLRDEKLDLDSLTIEVKGATESEWRDVHAPKMSEGKGDWIGSQSESYSVRATVRDRAGNVSVKRIEIPAADSAVAAVPAAPMEAAATDGSWSGPGDGADRYTIPPSPSRNPAARDPGLAADPGTAIPRAAGAQPGEDQGYANHPTVQAHTARSPVFDRRRPDLPAEPRAESSPIQQVGSDARVPLASGESLTRAAIASSSQTPPRVPRTAEAEPERKKIRLSNSRHFMVDYKLRGVGPSGVGKVEMFQTTDNGQTWITMGEDPDRQPPFEVTVPEDGRYGLTVVVTSPAGFGQRPPKAGDAPQMVVEVDTTPPRAELYQPVPDPNDNNQSLVISWSCGDPHLASAPVNLYFAEFPEGPWYLIKSGLPATGQYSWRIQENTPHHVFLRLMAADMGNNVSVADTPEAIIVDLARPEADVVDVISVLPDQRLLR